MANRETHSKRAKQTFWVGSALSIALPWPLGLGATLGLTIGMYASPDVRDQEQVRNGAEHDFTAQFGGVAGWLWSAYWQPLARLIPHRSYLSHFPPVATPIAFLYLFGPLALLQYLLVAWLVDITLLEWLLLVLGNQFMLGVLLGWALQDLVHLWDDGFKFYWGKG